MKMKVKIGFTIEPSLLQEIDRLRGITKRSTFMEHLLKLGIKTYKKENRTAQHIPQPRTRRGDDNGS
jgi:metal-responsive CopG/Arc/MetJ family transcriptional regulator